MAGVLLLVRSLNGHKFRFVGTITLILWFFEILERGLSDDVLKPKVNFESVFDKIPWAIV